jgi:hypothetical protein
LTSASRVLSAGRNRHPYDDHLLVRPLNPVCLDAGANEQDEVDKKQRAIEPQKDLLVDHGLSPQNQAVGARVAVPVVGVGIRSEQSGHDHGCYGHQPDDEVESDERARVHTLPLGGKHGGQELDDGNYNRKARLCC